MHETIPGTIADLEETASLVHQIVHGDTTTTVETEGGSIKSFAKTIQDEEDLFQAAQTDRANRDIVPSTQATVDLVEGYSQTVLNQGYLARKYADGITSVVPQDLSGVTESFLHRSPNTIVQAIVYDTSKDSDGGAWTDKIDASYLYETLNGPWLQPTDPRGTTSEADARLIGTSLGVELVDTANTAAAWTQIVGSVTISQDGSSVKIVGGANGSVAQVFLNGAGGLVTDPTVNALYKVWPTARVNPGGAVTLSFVNSTNAISYSHTDSQAEQYEFNQQPTASVWAFRVTVDAGETVWVELSVKQILGTFATSGSYYQNATDGKFYRLWKNRVQYSADLANAAWSRLNLAAVTSKADGLGDLIVPSTSNAQHYVQQLAIAVGAGPQTVTIRAKAGGYNWLWVNAAGGTGGGFFDLITGTLGTQSGVNSITPVPGMTGYYDCTTTFSTQNNGLLIVGVANANNSSSFAGDGASGVYVAQVQVEQGSAGTTYEAKTADGSQSEAFRGNKSRFPKEAAIVAEAARVVVYDLLEPGRPMWMVFLVGNGNMADSGSTTGLTCVAMREGKLIVGTNTTGLSIVDFAADRAYVQAGSLYANRGRISQRNAMLGKDLVTAGAIANNTINAVAMTTMPDAPVDPVTGLQVPTIAVATGAGASVIKHDGSVVSSGATAAMVAVSVTPYGVQASTAAGQLYFAAGSPSKFAAAFSTTAFNAGGSQLAPAVSGATFMPNRRWLGKRAATGLEFSLLNESVLASSLNARITDTYNTGWMVGDIRRCLLADVNSGTVNGDERIQDSGFDTGIGWTLGNTNAGPIATIGGGIMSSVRASDGSAVGVAVASFATIAGEEFTCVLSGCTGGTMNVRIGTSSMVSDITASSIAAGASPTVFMFKAIGDLTYVSIFNATNGTTATLSSCSVKRVVSDRSYKNKPLTVNGTLTKTVVSTGAKLSAYSGFSNDPDWTLERVTNGTFDTDTTGWTAGGGAVLSATGGRLRVTNPGTGVIGSAKQSFTTIPGIRYTLNASAFSGTATSLQILIGSTDGGTDYVLFTATTPGVAISFVATGTTAYIQLRNNDITTSGGYMEFDNISVKPASLNANVIREDFSADLDFGTDGFALSALVSIPSVLSESLFSDAGPNLVSNGDFSSGSTGWSLGTGWSFGSGVATHSSASNGGPIVQGVSIAGRFYRLTYTVTGYTTGTHNAYVGGSFSSNTPGNGTFTKVLKAVNTSGWGVSSGNAAGFSADNVIAKEIVPLCIADRSSSDGIYFRLGVNPDGTIIGIVYDGTTQRTVTSPTSYAGFEKITPSLSLAPNGTLTLKVNGIQVAQTTGSPMLSISGRWNKLNNSERFDLWSLTNATATSNFGIAPNGTTTSTRITFTGGGLASAVWQIPLAVSGQNGKVFLRAKMGTNRYIQILCNGDAAVYLNIDLLTGTLGTAGAKINGQTITSLGSGWYLISMQHSSTVATDLRVYGANSASETYSPTLTTGGTVELWGADFRTADTSFSLPYQRTGVSGSNDFDFAPFLTVGNNYALNSAFPGSIALVRIGATIPTNEQSRFIFQQESQMFRDGAQITLPDSSSLVDAAYNEQTDQWEIVSASNWSKFAGLVRAESRSVRSGSYSKIACASGINLTTRSVADRGVDITMPSLSIKKELPKTAEVASKREITYEVFDFDATASQTDFPLPTGFEAVEASVAGAVKREGSSKDWTRLFDGFVETVRFAVAPGTGVWVQIIARRITA